MALLKRIALTLPPLQKLHKQRNGLLLERNALLAAQHELEQRIRVLHFQAQQQANTLNTLQAQLQNETLLRQASEATLQTQATACAALEALLAERDALITEQEAAQARAEAEALAATPFIPACLTNPWCQLLDKAEECTTRPDTPDIAFLCSHGRTGNRWLGRVLNLHPEMVCGVGPLMRPYVEYDSCTDDSVIFDPNEIDIVEHFQAASVDKMLSTLKAYKTGYRFYVRAHAINAFQLMLNIREQPPGVRVSIANVIRHPVTRAPSYAREWLHTDGTDLHAHMETLWESGEHYRICEDEIRTRFPEIDLNTRENRYFIMGIFWLWNDLSDFTLPIRHFRFEELTGHNELLCGFLTHLLGKDFIITPDYIAKIKAERPANYRAAPKAAVEVYANWQPWQKYCFRRFMEAYNIDAAFQPFGYDFSFID